MDEDVKTRLHKDLVKLGDMLGDGDCDPWVGQAYKRTLKALGMLPKRRASVSTINEAVKVCLEKKQTCPNCQQEGTLVQTRSGAKRVKCTQCDSKFQLN